MCSRLPSVWPGTVDEVIVPVHFCEPALYVVRDPYIRPALSRDKVREMSVCELHQILFHMVKMNFGNYIILASMQVL